MTRVSRREAGKRVAGAAAGLALGDGILRGQSEEILVAGKRVELLVRSIGPSTVRITALPVQTTERPDDDSLVVAARGHIVARRRGRSNQPIRAGNLTVRITAGPPSIRIDTVAGKPIQRLTLDPASPSVSFLPGTGPLLGLGEGGPQFDRKGIVDRGRNGQGGYQLRTHGGRVPIQWLRGNTRRGQFSHHHP